MNFRLVQRGRELNFLHSDITVIILHGQILILYNWRPYLSVTPRSFRGFASNFRYSGFGGEILLRKQKLPSVDNYHTYQSNIKYLKL